jgi:endogenous inhibitor of DNA gyrase (YacG/DUF329 family)
VTTVNEARERWTHSKSALVECPNCDSPVELRGHRLNLETTSFQHNAAVTFNRSCPECGTTWTEVYMHHASVTFSNGASA